MHSLIQECVSLLRLTPTNPCSSNAQYRSQLLHITNLHGRYDALVIASTTCVFLFYSAGCLCGHACACGCVSCVYLWGTFNARVSVAGGNYDRPPHECCVLHVPSSSVLPRCKLPLEMDPTEEIYNSGWSDQKYKRIIARYIICWRFMEFIQITLPIFPTSLTPHPPPFPRVRFSLFSKRLIVGNHPWN